MLQTSSASTSAPTVPTSQGPLSPLNLLLAGVPASEVVWFRGLKPDRRMAALKSWRGQLLLGRVREAAAATGAPQLAAA